MYSKVAIGKHKNRKIFEVQYVYIGDGGTQVGVPNLVTSLMFEWYVVRCDFFEWISNRDVF